MVFAKEQAAEIKKQLLEQVEKLPQENKEQIKAYIENLDDEGLEEFLKKNKIKVTEKGISQEPASESETPQCIFCSIIKGEMPSYKIGENKKSFAILEINPVSKGHAIVLPKDHVAIEKMPKTSMSLAQKIAKKIKKKLKPDDIKIETSSFQGHALVNIIPSYKDIPLKKTKASEEELKKIQSKLETKKRSSRTPKVKEEVQLPKISFRIP